MFIVLYLILDLSTSCCSVLDIKKMNGPGNNNSIQTKYKPHTKSLG